MCIYAIFYSDFANRLNYVKKILEIKSELFQCLIIFTEFRIQLILKESKSKHLLLPQISDFTMEPIRANNNATPSIDMFTTGWETLEAMTKDTFMEEVKTYTIFKVANFINIYWFPVLIPIGLVGNLLSFIVMIKPNNRKMSTCIYMAAISINDNIMMCMCFHDYLVYVVQIHRWHSIECKMSCFAALFALQNGTFQVLAMTVDKYIAIRWPHKAATYSTPRRAKIMTVGFSICALMYNTSHFFLSGMIDDLCICYANSSAIVRVYSWFTFVLNAIIPFTMLIHLNYIIVKTVRKSRNLFKTDDTNTGMEVRQRTMKSVENQLTVMLLLVTTLFFILIFPTYFRYIYLLIARRDTPLQYANSMIIYQISYKLYASNSGINFFLYCISGQKFRNDLKKILCCCCQRKHQLQSSSTGVRTVNTERVLNPI